TSPAEHRVGQKQAKPSVAQTALLFGLALASLLAAGRVVQLAVADVPPTQGEAAVAASTAAPAQSAEAAKTAKGDAELANLYRACPMGAVIALATVAPSPARVDEPVPPYRETVHRVPNPPVEPAIPRIRYPISVRAETPKATTSNDVIHVAGAPHTTPGD